MKKLTMLLMLGTLVLLMLSCSFFSLQRTEDGALRAETTLSLQMLSSIIENAVDFLTFANLQYELREGYIFVHADSVEYQGITASNVSFHLELMAVNGKLAARVTNLDVSGSLIDESSFESYNQMLVDQLAQASQQNDQAFLESVSVSPEGIKMAWLLNPNPGN